ncbi:MATE family efflux transporter [Pseudoroseomonas rhizosphaerae]|uniref:Multidrug-efflux transporter n=1 Tax=Teichococcus rhizosphaerae TaxID=1335062 RepID=A0A2C7ABA7_9PROT|nr:MATE family efflux transporter [Pseudoroseomonas rhizosphaerae]PHK94923.1 MATE family efflux transporter [Pseudoroseomonas rhizosphaerae]
MLALAWPLALTNLSQVALVLTDTLFLGQLGEVPLAAATLGGNLYFIAMALPFGLAFATAAMLAQERGRVRHHMREMRRTVRQGAWLIVPLFAVLGLALWHTGAILRATGQDPALAEAAQTYNRALLWGMVPFYGFLLLRGFLAALERPGPALCVSMGAIGLNAVLDHALVGGGFGLPSHGVLGAGIASAVANGSMFTGLALWVALDRRLSRFRLAGRFWRADWRRMREIVVIGLPIAGTMLLEIGIFSATALVMGWFSPGAVAAHAVALQVASASFMVPMGIGQAATARVGLAAGAHDAAGAHRAGWTAIGLGAGFMLLAAAVLLSVPHRIAALFLAPELAETRALAVTLLMMAGLFQLADGVQAVAAGALRGLKDTRVPMLIAALGYWGLGLPIGLGLGFPAGWGPLGVWVGLASGLAIVAVLMTLRWARMARHGHAAPAAPQNTESFSTSGLGLVEK